MTTRKKGPSAYQKKLLQFVDRYIAETGRTTVDMIHVAMWAISNGLWEPRKIDVARQLQRDLSRAARQDYITDDEGEPVRRRHSYKVTSGEKQLTLWVSVEKATPRQMRLSAQARRRGILADCIQVERDLRYYNKNYNPGECIQLSFNFEPDMEERQLPRDYDDSPPPEEPEDS